jgi:mannose-6-phosphate isomerase-like protein (cupin superfamily)
VTSGSGADGFPGAVGISRLRVYDWPGPDGAPGGSPHLHTTSTEGYVVLAGTGQLQTLDADGYRETPLTAGTVLWFTPGTVHRLVNHGDLEILVVMQNAGLPEAGDAVLTFPDLDDPAAYARAAAVPTDTAAARRRRDLAVEGFLTLREGGPAALSALHQHAARLVRHRVEHWRHLWQDRPLAQAERTGHHLAALAAGDGSHLAGGRVRVAGRHDTERYGMCGRLTLSAWDLDGAVVPAPSTVDCQEGSP